MAGQKKIALVTGAASGMGRIYSRRLADSGYQVAIIDLNEQGLQETASTGGSFSSYVCDISNDQAVSDVITAIESDLGEVDYAVHCAAIMPATSVMNEQMDSLRRLTDINYFVQFSDKNRHMLSAVSYRATTK